MLFYTPLEFISMLMQLDGLVAGNHRIKEDPLRTALHKTTMAMSRIWGIPSPASLTSPVSPATTLSMLIEARRSQHVMFARRGLLIFHVDPKFRGAIALNRFLIKQRQQIDDMIIHNLGIEGKLLSEKCVVCAGGLSKSALEYEMLANF